MSTWSGRREFLAVLILICAALLWVKTTQLREESGGARWDGGHYLNLAAQIARGERPLRETSPYRNRIGVPLIVGGVAALSNRPLIGVAAAVTTISAVLAAFLLWVWLRRVLLKPSVRLIVVALFLAAWAGPLRYGTWYPTYVDAGWSMALCLGLWAIDRARSGARFGAVLVGVSSLLAVLMRETGLVIPLSSLTLLPSGHWRAVVAAALGTGLALGLVWWLVEIPADEGSLMLQVWRQRLAGVRPSEWGILWLVSYGPILVVLLLAPLAATRWLWRHPYALTILAVQFGVAALYPDARLCSAAAPIVLAIVGASLESLAPWRAYEFLVALVLAQSVALRLWWPIPITHPEDPGPLPTQIWLTAWDATSWSQIGIAYNSPAIVATMQQQYIVLVAVLVALAGFAQVRRALFSHDIHV